MTQNKIFLLYMFVLNALFYGCVNNQCVNNHQNLFSLSYTVSTNEQDCLTFYLKNKTHETFILQEPEMNIGMGYEIEYITKDDDSKRQAIDTVSQIGWSKFVVLPAEEEYSFNIKLDLPLSEIRDFNKVVCLFKALPLTVLAQKCKTYNDLRHLLSEHQYEIIGTKRKNMELSNNSFSKILSLKEMSSSDCQCVFLKINEREIQISILSTEKDSFFLLDSSNGIDYNIVYESKEGEIKEVSQDFFSHTDLGTLKFKAIEKRFSQIGTIATQTKNYTIKLPPDVKEIKKVSTTVYILPFSMLLNCKNEIPLTKVHFAQ